MVIKERAQQAPNVVLLLLRQLGAWRSGLSNIPAQAIADDVLGDGNRLLDSGADLSELEHEITRSSIFFLRSLRVAQPSGIDDAAVDRGDHRELHADEGAGAEKRRADEIGLDRVDHVRDLAADALARDVVGEIEAGELGAAHGRQGTALEDPREDVVEFVRKVGEGGEVVHEHGDVGRRAVHFFQVVDDGVDGVGLDDAERDHHRDAVGAAVLGMASELLRVEETLSADVNANLKAGAHPRCGGVHSFANRKRHRLAGGAAAKDPVDAVATLKFGVLWDGGDVAASRVAVEGGDGGGEEPAENWLSALTTTATREGRLSGQHAVVVVVVMIVFVVSTATV